MSNPADPTDPVAPTDASGASPSLVTEDNAHGGLDAVLAAELARYGIPAEAGLTGLLRHIYGNRDAVIGVWTQVSRTRKYRLDRVAALCAEAHLMHDGTLVVPVDDVLAAIANSSDNMPPEDDAPNT